MAPSTPPPPASAEFAAFTMASAGMRVMSPTTNFSNLSFGNLFSMGMLRGGKDDLAAASAKVHFIFDALNGRTRVVPIHASLCGLVHSAENLRRQERMYIMDGINLGGGDLSPGGAQ